MLYIILYCTILYYIVDPHCKLGTTGLRINPLVGSGEVEMLSTATATSKFGIPLNNHTKANIIELVLKFPYINALMCHVGSQVSTVSKINIYLIILIISYSLLFTFC